MSYRSLVLLIFLCILAGCGGEGGRDVSRVQPGAATLTWTAPTTSTDGAPIYDLAGYKLYYGTTSGAVAGDFPNSVVVKGANKLSHTVTGLSTGTWFFAVSAYDTSNNESVLSNVVSKFVI